MTRLGKKVREVQDLEVTRIALVRKGYVPVNDGARITLVKASKNAEEQRAMAEVEQEPITAEERSALAKFVAFIKGEKAEATPVEKADEEPSEADQDQDQEAAADDKVDAALAELRQMVEGLVAKLQKLESAQHQDDQLNKAQAEKDEAERLEKLVGEALERALAPVVKAWEDSDLARARASVTPNVTTHISPARSTPAVDPATLRDKTFGEAVRTLLAPAVDAS